MSTTHEYNPTLGWTSAQLHEHEIRFLHELAQDERLRGLFGGDEALTIIGLTMVIACRDNLPGHLNVEEQATLGGIRRSIIDLTGMPADWYVKPGFILVAQAIQAVVAGNTTPALDFARAAIIDKCANPNASLEIDPRPTPKTREDESLVYPDKGDPNPALLAVEVEPTPFALVAYLIGWGYRHEDTGDSDWEWRGDEILSAFDPVYYALYEGGYNTWTGGSTLTEDDRAQLASPDTDDDSQEILWERLVMLGYCGGRLVLKPAAA